MIGDSVSDAKVFKFRKFKKRPGKRERDANKALKAAKAALIGSNLANPPSAAPPIANSHLNLTKSSTRFREPLLLKTMKKRGEL